MSKYTLMAMNLRLVHYNERKPWGIMKHLLLEDEKS
jgi:hypothetical protein